MRPTNYLIQWQSPAIAIRAPSPPRKRCSPSSAAGPARSAGARSRAPFRWRRATAGRGGGPRGGGGGAERGAGRAAARRRAAWGRGGGRGAGGGGGVRAGGGGGCEGGRQGAPRLERVRSDQDVGGDELEILHAQ